MNMRYIIHWAKTPPPFGEAWDAGAWREADALSISHFHPRSAAHRPQTDAKLLYDADNLYLRFRVRDQYVKAAHTAYQDHVSDDSCVEFFVMPSLFNFEAVPSAGSPQYRGYFNIETNCIGTLLLYHIEDWQRTTDGFARYTKIDQERLDGMRIVSSLRQPIVEEIVTPVEWEIGYALPFCALEAYVGPLEFRRGRPWKGNFFKCGDLTSQPHWASWSPIGEELNFHQPAYFGALEFGD